MGSTNSHRFELVSFDLCPYVQRSVITLMHKKVDFKLTLIDLSNPPEWFNKISPLGKVPLLLVRESEHTEPTVLFESAVINEYVDEVTPPALMPEDPLEKAFERAWIAVAGELMMTSYPMMASQDLSEIEEAKKEMFEVMEKLEDVMSDGPYFSGKDFSLVDAAYAPFFMRMDLFKGMREDAGWKKIPKTRRWADTLGKLDAVKRSVRPDFTEAFAAFLKKREAAWANQVNA